MPSHSTHAARSNMMPGQSKDIVRIGLVGMGVRGKDILKILLDLDGVEVPAICDVDDAQIARSRAIIEQRGVRQPDAYSKGNWDFMSLLERDDLDAVITATPWEWHAPIMIQTMKSGKYGGVEVPAGVTVDECWDLVETSEATGMPCMMLENVNYLRNSMMIFNMVRQGGLGELVHCEAGYQHDVRRTKFDDEGRLRWRGWHSVLRNGNLYPMHAIGPVACWLDINHGDRFSYLVSMSSTSRGLNAYASEVFGPEHENARRTYALGDVNTTLIRTEKGRTVTLYHDTSSPRPYDLILRVQGTKGIYHGSMNKIYVHEPGRRDHQWEDPVSYYDRYEHPLWRDLGATAVNYGHGGGDFLAIYRFVQTVRHQTHVPIDIYDSVTWSVIAALTEESVANRSAPVDFPDFTRGAWRSRKPIEIVGADWASSVESV